MSRQMGDLVDNKFTWVIKNFNSLKFKDICSDQFLVGGCKWQLYLLPMTNLVTSSLYLTVAGNELLPCGWRRRAKVSFTLVNQVSQNLSQERVVTQQWFAKKNPSRGIHDMLLLTKIFEGDSGFLVNGELKIIVEVDVLEVIGKLDESESDEPEEETSQPLQKRKQYNDGVLSTDLLYKTQQLKEVNGFLVLPSQAESVTRIFENHPNVALNFQAKSQHLRTSCMNVLLDVIKTLCQSLQDLSIHDLGQADNALTYLKNSGFKVDWLERKLEEVKEKKIEEEVSETRMQELEVELKGFKQKCSDFKKKCSNTEALLKKEKAKVLAARVRPLTLNDVV